MDQLEQLEACRICVTCFSLQEMDFINIFQESEEFQQELNFIQGEIQQWQLKIQPDDGLPQRICANCFAKFCNIDAFRRECEQAQEKLIETVLQQTGNVEQEIKTENEKLFQNSVTSLPLVGNYETRALECTASLAQTDVSLNDFPVVFDQQFTHFDNSVLMDATATLLDTNLIASETPNDLQFLPSQNLFTFETAEPPSTGTTLPLAESDATSIINDLLEVETEVGVGGTAGEGNIMKQDDLEDMLKHSIIPTTAKLNIKTKQHNKHKMTGIDTQNIKTEMDGGNWYTKIKSESQNISSNTILNHEDNCSDNEYDETDINARLKGLPYACHYCFCPNSGPIDHLIFPNEDALSQHFFDKHDPNRPYTCPHCIQSFKTQVLRDNHVKVLHKITESITCNFCRKHLRGSMEVHQYNCQYVSDWECDHCKEKFKKTPLYRFRLHQRQHERIKNWKCRLCERSFMKKANLEAHERMHKTEVKICLQCDICNKNFSNELELKFHQYQTHNADSPFKCKLCNKDFSGAAYLQRHINQLHSENHSPTKTPPTSTTSSSETPSTNEPRHVCLNCNLVFKSIQRLQNHLLLGRDKNGNCLYTSCNKQERRKLQRQGVFPCFHCPKRFHLRSQLDKHINTHDARLRPFQCQQCYVRCRTATELKQHVNVDHLNIKAFACDKCAKCFGYKKDLRDHMLFHAELNVHCKEKDCDYVCKNDKALNDHIRHKHRLLSCEYCNDQFTRQKLTAHLRNIHRTEINVELASESDQYYKSQLLNNNNDITQISFNLLNTQTQKTPLGSTASSPSSTQTSYINSKPRTLSSIINSPTSSISSLSSSCLSHTKSTTLTASSTRELDNEDEHNQYRSMFVNDANDRNATLNELVVTSSEHVLNLNTNDEDTTNMFLVPPSSSANDNNLDQYFMGSLIDAEQEIIVT